MNLFEYVPGNTAVHNIDPRLKFFSLWALSILILKSHLIFTFSFLAIAFLTAKLLHLTPGRVILRILPIFIIIAVSLIFQVFDFIGTGDSDSVNSILMANLKYMFQIFTLVICGHIFIATTSMAELRKALLWLTRPLPVKLQNIICLGAFLTIRFIPVLSDELATRSAAIKLRGLNPSKKPLKYISLLISNLLISAFKKSYGISDALMARGFMVNRRINHKMPFTLSFFAKSVAIATFTYVFVLFMSCEFAQIM